MQLFIGRIPKNFIYEDLYDYFSKAGKIKTLKLLDGYGFLCFEEREDAIKVLEAKHNVNGFDIAIEEATSKKDDNRMDIDKPKDWSDARRDTDRVKNWGDARRDDYDRRSTDYDRRSTDYDRRNTDYDRRNTDYDRRNTDYDRRNTDYDRDYERKNSDYDRDYDRRRDSRGRDWDSRRRDDYDRRRDYDDRRRDDNYGRSLSNSYKRCEYCGHYPPQGTDRGYASSRRAPFDDEIVQNIPKIVLMGINPDTQIEDVKEFVKQYNLESSYVRITHNKKFAIVEFKTLEEKDKALICLENKELLGSIVQARSFKITKREFEEERKRYRRNDEDTNNFYNNKAGEGEKNKSVITENKGEEKNENIDDLYDNLQEN